MTDRITIGPPGSILDWDNWGKPVTDAINDFQNRLAALETAPILKAIGIRTSNSSTTTTEVGVLRIDDIVTTAGHRYEIKVNAIALHSTVNGDVVRANIRYTTDGSTPTTASTALTDAQLTVNNTTFPTTNIASGSLVATLGQVLSVLLSVQRISGSGNAQILGSATFPIELYINDLGPDSGDVGVDI